MYKYLIKPLFFLFQPETIHRIVFKVLRFSFLIPGVKQAVASFYTVSDSRLEKQVFGMTFKNPVGLAAGFDKDAELFDELSCFGFGFIEVGTLTPLAQPGNEKPRMFRVPSEEALINRMGFNNKGVHSAADRLKTRKPGTLIGGNIGKNKLTDNADASRDYQRCFEVLFDFVDFFVVNVSSPNTPGLRALQEKEPLTKLLMSLTALNSAKPVRKPILLKISPDLSDAQLDDIVSIIAETKLDGVIATNTTIAHPGHFGPGGLSGKPLSQRSTEVIRYLAEKSNRSFPIIGVGGIHCAGDALEKLSAGASLVQIYTGFIYEGPGLVKKINKAILKCNAATTK